MRADMIEEALDFGLDLGVMDTSGSIYVWLDGQKIRVHINQDRIQGKCI